MSSRSAGRIAKTTASRATDITHILTKFVDSFVPNIRVYVVVIIVVVEEQFSGEGIRRIQPTRNVTKFKIELRRKELITKIFDRFVDVERSRRETAIHCVLSRRIICCDFNFHSQIILELLSELDLHFIAVFQKVTEREVNRERLRVD